MPTDRHRDALRGVMQDVPDIVGHLWHDTETATLMRERGVRRICARDTDFYRYGFLEPIDPLTGHRSEPLRGGAVPWLSR